jgi:hypothetical protein
MSDTPESAAAGAAQLDDDLSALARDTASEARVYLDSVTDVAAGSNPETALSVLLLALSQVLLAGARLGAISDVVPAARFEPDPGPEPDVDPLHVGLANALEGLDDYGEIFDPIVPGGVVHGSLSGDLSEVASALDHGLHHFEAGRTDEALWWWQFSYLSSWGPRASSALRVVQSILGHLRLDADDEVVADLEFDALNLP